MGLQYVALAQVTKVGNDTLLDIAGWNVEWFGDLTNGPTDEQLQFTNVKNLIAQTDIDVWGLAEVSDPTTFANLLADLPDYGGVNSTFSQTQKMALMWKKAKFSLVGFGNILTESTYNYDFAGRPPLEVVLRSKNQPVKNDTIYFYIVHLKANSGSADQSSYDRRKNAAATLKTFLDQNRSGKKCIVLGDWNDDVDQSVVRINSVYLESPFLSFVNDSTHYFYASKQLSLAGENSYVSSQNMIDHQLMTAALKDSFYVANSAMVMKQTASQITGYATNTSDHYPVLARYNFNRKEETPSTGLQQIQRASIHVYPNPATDHIVLEGVGQGEVYLVSITGMAIPLKLISTDTYSTADIPVGLYTLMIQQEYQLQRISRVLIQNAD